MTDLPSDIDTSRPHSARIYDYYLGGKNHFAADRETADKVMAEWPNVRVAAREQRKFLGRAVRYLAEEAGVRQFMDVGTGLPTTNNVHEIAQRAAPETHVVYVDNDPLVLAHARALLTSSPEGRTAYIHADLRRPSAILEDEITHEVLDFGRPIALVLVGILHLLPDTDQPARIIRTLVDALPSGSYLVSSHLSAEHDPEGMDAGLEAFRRSGVQGQFRDADEFAELAFRGLELVEPGVVLVNDWRPDESGPTPRPAEVSCYGAVARKP